MKEELSKATRTESDLIGEREVPETALYGVQTLRGIENFRISKYHLCEYPLFINALAITKMGAAMANFELGLLTEEQANAILRACKPIPCRYDTGWSRNHHQHECQRGDSQPRTRVDGT